MHPILGKYKSEAIERGSELLFKWQTAMRILDECKNQNVTVLGMDFFNISTDGKRIPITSSDSEKLTGAQTVDVSINLIKDRFPDNAQYVSFVLR